MNLLKNNPVTKFVLTHKIISIIGFILLVALIVIFRPKAPTKIETVAVNKGTITQAVTATGTIASLSSVNLNFTTSGKLVTLCKKKGERIGKGQVLAALDSRTTQKNFENAMRDYAKQRNTFEQTKDDENVNSLTDAQNDTVKRILENNQFDLEKSVASVELQELAKQSSVLTSPIDGILIRSDVTVTGINVGPTTIFTVADSDNLVFQVDVDEADIGKVREGQVMKISLDAYPDDSLSAVISSIDFSSHATSTGGTAFTVEGDLPVSVADRFRIGMNGDVEIITTQKKNIFTVPISSLVDETHVYVKNEKSFERKEIKTGIQSDIDIEVKSGLNEGMEIAVLPDDVEKQFPKLKVVKE